MYGKDTCPRGFDANAENPLFPGGKNLSEDFENVFKY